VLIFDARLFADNAADDALVAGSTISFCRLVCLCVKRRNAILNGKRHSLLNSALFRADNHTEQKIILPFSLALIFTFDFAAFSERRSCPEVRSRRFVLLGALNAALRQRTYHVRTVMQFSRFRCGYRNSLTKKYAISRISKRLENAQKKANFHAYGQMRKREEDTAMQVNLTIQERLKDLRVERGLTLEQLSEKTGISKSALGKYEAEDFKDISPYSMVELAKFYGVSTDYLVGLTEQKNHPNTELEALHLGDDAIEVLRTGRFNHRLLSELICHKDFQRFMLDAEIYVDRIADMRIKDMNAVLETVRRMMLEKAVDSENDLYLRTMEVAQIREDEYFSHLISDDLSAILRDIRENHKSDNTTADEDSTAAKVQQQLQEAMNFEGSSDEKKARAFLMTLGIDYDKLTKEQFVTLIDILRLSKHMKSPISQRGKAKSHSHGKKRHG
jgi:transcriptional regulator with XRE-family HTH domain